ncbi:MAG TPA: ATP-binding protein [Phycisphaerae bacterium]|nr:ATP-binding protein [Phycisphaerae bacterium]
MKELVVISGKGGTGKTSLVASFAALSREAVVADCDVDAADLHLVLSPTVLRRESFSGGAVARIKPGHCTACAKCQELCRFDAIFLDGPGNGRIAKTFRVDPIACEGCGVCVHFCAEGAVEFVSADSGKWFVSETRVGPMVHARLGVAQENSGKLVSLIREQARALAVEHGRGLILVDGSPGIGCPVIASITGADMALVVAEPTLSGLHDLTRVAELAGHFGIPAAVCVNKWDLNAELADRVESEAARDGLAVVGRVRYDRAVTDAQIRGLSVVEHSHDGLAEDVRKLWTETAALLARSKGKG